MKTKMLFDIVCVIGVLLLVAATTTEVNIANLPTATSLASSNAVLVLTNATKARLATVQQILNVLNTQTNLNLGVSNIMAKGYASLSGQTNRLIMSGGNLLLDGAAVGGGDTVWTNDAGLDQIHTTGTDAA